MKQFLFWTPRVAIIIFALFLELFAFDEPIFSIGFLMHSLPSLVILLTLLIAWKWERFGACLYIFLGIFSVFFFDQDDWLGVLIVNIPPFIVGGLFWLSYRFSQK